MRRDARSYWKHDYESEFPSIIQSVFYLSNIRTRGVCRRLPKSLTELQRGAARPRAEHETAAGAAVWMHSRHSAETLVCLPEVDQPYIRDLRLCCWTLDSSWQHSGMWRIHRLWFYKSDGPVWALPGCCHVSAWYLYTVVNLKVYQMQMVHAGSNTESTI